jgi:hypothetical protein
MISSQVSDLRAFLTGVVLATGDSAFYACDPGQRPGTLEARAQVMREHTSG